MKTFILSAALFGIAAQAQDQPTWTPFKVIKDSNMNSIYIKSKSWSDVTVDQDSYRLHIRNNNSVLLTEQSGAGYEKAWKPWFKGGAFSATVDLSKVGCGCVAGVYAVRRDCAAASDDPSNCQVLDVMQANKYGWQTAARPCLDGQCDPISQCRHDMHVQGEAIYGLDAYGPGGDKIDTNRPFKMKTEFVSDKRYSAVWTIKTYFEQDGEQKMMLQSYCPDFLEPMASLFDGAEAWVFSSWDNRSGKGADFETYRTCPKPASSCEGAMLSIADVKVNQWGFTADDTKPDEWQDAHPEEDYEPSDEDQFVDPQPVPVPVPVPAQFLTLMAHSQAKSTEMVQFFVKGLDDRELTTDGGFELTIGENNRAFILEDEIDDTVSYAYKDSGYLGGSVEFDANLVDVGCGCAASVYATFLDDVDCNWNPTGTNMYPKCSNIDLMQANKMGFNTNSKPCPAGGSCAVQPVCVARATDISNAYGSGSSYKINTESEFHVRTEFWTKAELVSNVNTYTELYQIKTILTQDSNTVELVQDCSGLSQLTSMINDFSLGVNNMVLGVNNSVSPSTCSLDCKTSQAKISNLRWKNNDSVTQTPPPDPCVVEPSSCQKEVDKGYIVVDGPAQSLDLCDGICAECHEAHFSNFPGTLVYQCMDTELYKYGNVCTPGVGKWDESKCMTADHQKCHKSYPYGDPDKMNSPDAACRTIPAQYITSDVDYGKYDCWSPTGGLCDQGCSGTCKNSWLRNEIHKWDSPTAMCRCRE